MSTQTQADDVAGIVEAVDQVTPAWLTAILRDAGTIASERHVTAVRMETIGTGTVGCVARAHVDYDAPAPPSFIVKLGSPDAGSRQIGREMGLYETEVRFYQEYAPRLRSAAIPRIHWANIDPPTGRFTLVLDDLSAHSEAGDMIAGCTLEQAKLALGVLPGFQVPFWDDPELQTRPWLGADRTDSVLSPVAASVEPFLARFGDRLGPEHVEIVRRMGPKAAMYRERVWKSPFVIAHTDYRLDNMMFGRDRGAPPISVIDWQAARMGPPLLDPAIFLATCMRTEQRREHERGLLRAYHDGLMAAGVRGFSFEDCLESYRRCSPFPLLGAIPVSVTVVKSERGDEMWARIVRGCANVVIDTGADDLLD
jgi:Phosphotransferase enzyme family